MSDQRWDPAVVDWLAEGPERGPRHALDRALAATRRVDQRPAWVFPGRWLPWTSQGHLRGRTTGVWLVVGLLLSLLLAGLIAIGGLSHRSFGLLGPSRETLIAFQQDGSVYVSRADGSARRMLSAPGERAGSPLFSPDGTRVAYLVQAATSPPTARLMVVPADGTSAPLAVSVEYDVLADDVPNFDWSPDGARLAFAASVGGASRIVVGDAEESRATVITADDANRDHPSWSPDGQRIAFRETSMDGMRRALRMAKPDGTDVIDLDDVVAADGSLSRFSWQPHGERAAYALGPGFGTPTQATIWLGGYGHIGVPWTQGAGGFEALGIPWAHDGRKMAILTRGDGVMLADDDPTDPYDQATRNIGHVLDCWVDWSPDGTALYGGSPGTCAGVVVIPLADPSAAITLPGAGPGMASWQVSPGAR